MRVVMLAPTFPKVSESFLVAKFMGLLGDGVDVHVVCASAGGEAWSGFPALSECRAARRRVHRTWPHRPRLAALALTPAALLKCLWRNPSGTVSYLRRGWARYGADILRRLYLDSEIIALRPDIVHFEFGSLAVGRTYLRELLDCKLVVSFRGYDLNYSGIEDSLYYEKVWSSADAVHVLGEDLWNRALDRGCPADKRHALIPPALDIESFKPRPSESSAATPPDGPLRVLSVGRLEWIKGYEYALQAIKLLVEKGIPVEYRIVGDGTLYEAISFARHQLGVEDAVQIVGALPHDKVQEEMGWADVFLHPAVSEGFCNVVIEAQAMGVPVVCSNAGGLPENVVDGVTGFVTERRDPVAFAESLARLAQDAGLRQRMGSAGRARVKERFELRSQIARFRELYDTVLRQCVASREEQHRSDIPEAAPDAGPGRA